LEIKERLPLIKKFAVKKIKLLTEERERKKPKEERQNFLADDF